MSNKSAMWQIFFRATPETAEALEEAVYDHVEGTSRFKNDDETEWRVSGYSRAEPDAGALRAAMALRAAALGISAPPVSISMIEPRDWVDETLRSFAPVEAGRYFVYGSHYEGTVPLAGTGLKLDAATAFGSGEHETTRGCLLALDRLARTRRFGRILDMGCGSGILALAAAATWAETAKCPIIASDIDHEAARMTGFNAQRNGLATRVRAMQANGYDDRRIARGGPYDLILSNILMRPLCRMAKDLSRHLAPGGYAVLSGFLDGDDARVLAAHRAGGLRLVSRIPIGAWRTLVLKKP